MQPTHWHLILVQHTFQIQHLAADALVGSAASTIMPAQKSTRFRQLAACFQQEKLNNAVRGSPVCKISIAATIIIPALQIAASRR